MFFPKNRQGRIGKFVGWTLGRTVRPIDHRWSKIPEHGGRRFAESTMRLRL
jgi:hypothetical protein